MTDGFWEGIAGTIVLWGISGAIALILALLLAAASLSSHKLVSRVGRTCIHLTRGVPTSVLVIAAGLGAMRLPPPDLPILFPATLDIFQHIAWAIALALALGSAGHLAEIFLGARATLGRHRIEQLQALGLSPLAVLLVIGRECAAVAMPPVGARLVHHLHNTAFAALFPVTDLFGYLLTQSNSTFQVFYYVTLGCLVYIVLSGLIWGGFRVLEGFLASPLAAQRLESA